MQPHVVRTFGFRHSVLVILLTLVAGILRFSSIDKPSIWGDEASSWRRISGSYQQLVDELRIAGFMPGHYLVTWWIKEGFPYWGEYREGPAVGVESEGARGFRRLLGFQSRTPRMSWVPTHRIVEEGFTPTPLVMRFVPALCGTLMVPAMYFLACQLVARRTALLVALFTCCSAYMLNYSRDSKMYMQLWFFATLHVACLLWWLRAYRRDQPMVMARPQRSKAIELGDGVADVLPREHVGRIARAFGDAPQAALAGPTRIETLFRWMCWLTSGLAMIAFHTVGLAIVGIELLIVLATVPQRLRLRWPARRRRRPEDAAAVEAPPPVAALRFARARALVGSIHIPPLLSFLIGAAVIVSVFSSYREFSRFYDRVEPSNAASTQYDINDAGIGWVAEYNYDRDGPGHFLYNATAYLFNWEWVKPNQMKDVDPQMLTRLRRTSITFLVVLAVGLLPWRQLIDRLMRSRGPAEAGPMPATSLLIIAVWLAVPAFGFYVASGTLSAANIRAGAPTPTAIAAMALAPVPDALPLRHPMIGAVTNQLRSWMAGKGTFGEAWNAVAALPWRTLFVVEGFDWSNARGWLLWIIAGSAVVIVASRRSTLRGWARMVVRMLGVAMILYLLLLAVYVLVPLQSKSVWMPRYLGFIWPAFAIAVCVLIQRLPFLPVRAVVVIALVATNLINFRARCSHGEPPTALIAADQLVMEGPRTSRMFAPSYGRTGLGGPGSGGPLTLPNAYYLAVMSRAPVTPVGAFTLVERTRSVARLGRNYADAIRGTLRRDGSVNDFYVWATVPLATEPGAVEANLRKTLPAGWQPSEPVQRWTIYDHWTWRQLYVLERHHWRRQTPAATTRAATRPATTNATQASDR